MAVAGVIAEYNPFHRGHAWQIAEIRRRLGDGTAVVACNDLMAFGCMKACRDTGLRIPRDVSVISLDNTDFCCCTVPMLSSVDMMQFQLGSNAAQLLLERIEGKRDYKKAIALEPVLVARDSAAKLKK